MHKRIGADRRALIPWTARDLNYGRHIRPDAGIADLDLELAQSFLAGADRPGESAVDALLRLGLIDGDAPDRGITHAALLLFGRPLARKWHPGAGIRVMRVAGTARILGQRQSTTWIGHADPPLARAVPKGLQMIAEQCRQSEPLLELLLADMPEYPGGVLREALVNAVAHRDYERSNSETEVVFFDDRVEVSSPGLLADGVTVPDLTSGEAVHATRNPLLVNALVAAGHMRAQGSGLPRMFRAMKESLLTEPRFAARGGVFTITLHNEPEVATAGPGWKHVVGGLGIDRDQKRVLLARPDGFTRDEFLRLNAVPAGHADRRIRDLVDRGIVKPEFIDDDGVPVYYLTSDLDSTRWFLEERVPRLRKHFSMRSKLRSADYRELFEVSYPVARRELGLLVELGFLREGGRGRSTHYLPTAGLRK